MYFCLNFGAQSNPKKHVNQQTSSRYQYLRIAESVRLNMPFRPVNNPSYNKQTAVFCFGFLHHEKIIKKSILKNIPTRTDFCSTYKLFDTVDNTFELICFSSPNYKPDILGKDFLFCSSQILAYI